MTKRTRIQAVDETYTSASSVHNFMLNDPILDYLKLKYPDERDDFLDCILQKGNEFEKKVIDVIKSKTKAEDFVQIAYNQEDILLEDNYLKTVEAIEKKVPVIYQGVLHDHKNKVYGCPDLIIRLEYLLKLFIDNDITNCFSVVEDGNSDHYVIVDIKFTKLYLDCNGKMLLSRGRSNANKGQVLIYNRLLSMHAKSRSRYAYIMGRGYEYKSDSVKYSSDNPFSKLGVVDCSEKELNTKVDNAVKWLEELKKNYKEWEPGTRPELYPNMCNTYDLPYSFMKKKIAKELEEITLLWNVGVKHRNDAHKANIYKWSDERLSSDVMNMKGKTADVVDKILEANRSSHFVPSTVQNNTNGWKDKQDTEYYIDFETINDIFDCGHITFMIGVYVSSTNGSYYKSFIAEDLTQKSEEKIFRDFTDFCYENNCYKFYHWGTIEKTILSKMLKKLDIDDLYVYCDIADVVRSEPVVLKNCFGFGLKEFGKALMEQKLINMDSVWEGNVKDGLSAMVKAYNLYRNSKDIREDLSEIVEYNKVDCVMTCEIVKYLRSL